MSGGNIQSYLNYLNEYGANDNKNTYEEPVGFVAADYAVFTLTLLIALGIGVVQAFTGDKQRTTKEYLMGNRNLSVWPVALSTFMSVISGILVLGTTAEMYLYGTALWMDSVGRGFTYAISAHLFVPMMYELKLTSVFTYHRLRFLSDGFRMLCVVMAMISSLFYMGLAMYAPATALEAVTGFPVWATLVCTGVVAVIYTTVGGIKAVVYTDFFQAFILFGGLLAILIAGSIEVGGLDVVWQISKDNGRINFFNMDPDPTQRTSFWAVMIGSSMLGLAQSGYEQTQIQRYCALPTVKQAKIAVFLQIPLLLAVYVLVCLVGLVVFAYYEIKGCDPLRSGLIDNSNQLVPWFMVDVLNAPGFPGLFVAVLFSGALSSVSSSMNSLAAITWKDIVEKRIHNVSERGKAIITKSLSFAYGTIGVIIGFTLQVLRGHVMQISSAVLGGLYGPLSAVVFAGAIFPWIHATGMCIGVIAGLFMTTWINIGQLINYPHRSHLDTNVQNCTHLGNTTATPIEDDPDDIFGLYKVSYLYIGFIGFVTTILVALFVSFITGRNDPTALDPRTMIDVGERCCCCLAQEKQEKCWCGIPFDELEEHDHDGKDAEMKEPNEMPDMERGKEDDHKVIANGKHIESTTSNGYAHKEDKSYTPPAYSSFGHQNSGYENTNDEVTEL